MRVLIAGAAMLGAVGLGVGVPVAHAQPAPEPQQVNDMLIRLTDAGISYKEKSALVENGISSQEGHSLDHELRKAYRGGELPYAFDVTDIASPAPGQAVATVTMSGPKMAPQTNPVQLVDQNGWVLGHDSAVQLFHVIAAH